MTEEFAVLFEMLEDLARAKSKDGEPVWGQLVYESSDAADYGFRIYLVGKADSPGEGEFFHPLVRRTIAKGAYEPGVYAFEECIGGALLTPAHRTSKETLFDQTKEKELKHVLCGMRQCLKRNGIEPSLSAADEAWRGGLHIVR